MNHSLNYSSYIENIKNESSHYTKISAETTTGSRSVLEDDPGADHFDPVAFYSSIDDDDALSATKIEPAMLPAMLPPISTPNLRRSGRPKPAAEALMSSPPAIKFYESTVVRNKPAAARKKKAAATTTISNLSLGLEEDISKADFGAKTDGAESPVLKLRLPVHSQSSSSSSKENISDKRNLRVVKLMMPDITAEEPEEESVESRATVKLRSAKAGFNSSNDDSNSKVAALLPLLAPKAPGKRLRTEDKAAAPLAKRENIINEDVCSSCGGLGNFICCDACPRSFHFTCAEPPLDPRNLPDDDWFCCECRREEGGSGASSSDIWGMMRGEAGRMNPKCFVMPRRFRFQPKEDDLQKLLSGQLFTERDNKPAAAAAKPAKPPVIQIPPTQPAIQQISLNQPTPILINESLTLDHCTIKTPNISSLKSAQGYCHCCGRYGLTRSALQRSSEDPSIPCDLRLQRPILSCNICPLYWHLDCLDPPRASFPANADAGWTCPIHFTTEKCLALELAEALVQSTLLLPEDAVKRQFEHKVKRRRNSLASNREDNQQHQQDQEDSSYGINDRFVHVPEVIKQFYK